MKNIIPLSLLLIVMTSKAQITRTILKKDTMSCFIGDWEKNKDLSLKLYNSSGSAVAFFPRTSLYKDDTLLISCDNPVDTLLGLTTDTLHMNKILYIDSCFFVINSIQYFIDYGRLRPGQYKFVSYLIDTFGSQIGSGDSITFLVDGSQSAGLRYPINNAEIYRPTLPLLTFKWFPVMPYAPTNTTYNLIVKQMSPGQTPEQAWVSNSALINLNFLNKTSWAFDLAYYPLFTSTNRYIWRIVTYDFSTGHWVGNNYGRSEIYEFEIDNDTTNTEPLTYENGTRCLPVDFNEQKYLGWEQDTFRTNSTSPNLDESRVYHDSRFSIRPNGILTDPYVSTLPTFKDQYSAKFNNDVAGGLGCKLKFLYTIDSNHTLFNMSYAMVMEDPVTHTVPAKPYFSYQLYRGKEYSAWDYIDYWRKYSTATDPFFMQTGTTDVLYKDWNCYRKDLTNRLGQAIRVVLTSAWCQPSGHFGYAYADFCVNDLAVPHIYGKSEFCISEPIILFGDSSENEDTYTLSIAECDSLGNADTSTLLFSSPVVKVADTLNINSSFSSQNFIPKCNQYYKVTLKVFNECTDDSVGDVQIIKIKCPAQGLAGDDKCCDHPPIILGSVPALANTSYSWSPTDHLSSYTASQVTFLPDPFVTYPKTYYLTVKDLIANCETKDTVTIFCTPPVCSASSAVVPCEGNSVLPNCPDQYTSILWTFKDYGTKGNYTSYSSKDTAYFDPKNASCWAVMEVTNPCGSKKDSVLIFKQNKDDIDSLYVTANAIDPNSEHLRNLKIFFRDKDTLTYSGHAYNDYYCLQVLTLDRWGGIFESKTFYNPGGSGFHNEEVYWDRTLANGHNLEEGVYHIAVRYKKCSEKDNWQYVDHYAQLSLVCEKTTRHTLFGAKHGIFASVVWYTKGNCYHGFVPKDLFGVEATIVP